MSPPISIVTPWLDAPELADDYLALVGVRGRDDEVIVVDNASNPPLALLGIKPLRLEENRGFARASNLGLAAASNPWVLFLNNDVRMLSADWLRQIRREAARGYLLGACLRYDFHGDVDGRPYPYLDGWCLGGWRDELMALGGFSEAYTEPAYYCDNDLCYRARRQGMRLREVRCGVEHLQSYTVGELTPARVRQLFANKAVFQEMVRADRAARAAA